MAPSKNSQIGCIYVHMYINLSPLFQIRHILYHGLANLQVMYDWISANVDCQKFIMSAP